MSSSFRVEAIQALVPDANFSTRDGEILIWDSDKEQPSEEAIKTKELELIEADKNIQYQRDRATSYPSIQEQLDMQYWDAVNGTKKWQEAVAKVKTDHPKPSK